MRADSSGWEVVGGERFCTRLYEGQNEEEASMGTAGPSFLLPLLLLHNSLARESRCFQIPEAPKTAAEGVKGVSSMP